MNNRKTFFLIIAVCLCASIAVVGQAVAPPVGVACQCGQGNNHMTITWIGQPQDVAYRITVNNLYDNEVDEITIPNNNTYTYVHDDVDESETYILSVRAIQNGVNGFVMSEAASTMGTCPTGYATVVNLDRIPANGGNSQIFELGPITFCNQDSYLPMTIRARTVGRESLPFQFVIQPNECKTLGQTETIYRLTSLTEGFELHPTRFRVLSQQKTNNTIALEPVLSVSPNPVQNQLKITYQVPQDEAVNLFVYNLQGQVVATLLQNDWKQMGEYELMIDIATLPQGTYQLQYLSTSQTQIRQFIKITD